MIRDKKELKDWELLHSTEDPVKRRALLSSIVSRRLEEQGFPKPIIVGGEALEIYSSGQFTTGDIDIKAPLEELRSVLFEMGFVQHYGVFYHSDLEIGIDWTGASLEEGEEAEQRTVEVQIQKNLSVRLVSIEDLVIDRLSAYKWWGDQDSRIQAQFLLQVKPDLDYEYLKERAGHEELKDSLDEILDLKGSGER